MKSRQQLIDNALAEFDKKFYCDDCSKYHFVDDIAGSTLKSFISTHLNLMADSVIEAGKENNH